MYLYAKKMHLFNGRFENKKICFKHRINTVEFINLH